VLTHLRMRSAADHQRLEDDPEITRDSKRLRKIARPHRDAFGLVWVFIPPAEGGAVSASRGAY
jgi:hypothetical protein